MSHHSGTQSDQKELTKSKNKEFPSKSGATGARRKRTVEKELPSKSRTSNKNERTTGTRTKRTPKKDCMVEKENDSSPSSSVDEDNILSDKEQEKSSSEDSSSSERNENFTGAFFHKGGGGKFKFIKPKIYLAGGNIDSRNNFTAMKMACKGGTFTTTEHGATNTLAVQPPSGDTSSKESPLTSGANGARLDRTSENDSSSILNGVWMQKDSARIESVFFKDTDALKLGSNMFLNSHKCLSWPGQIFASEGDTVQLKIGFKQPPDMQIEPDKERLKITKTLLRRIWHPTYFMPNPGPYNMRLGQLCKASYEAEVFTCEGKTTTGGFSDELHFSWPLKNQQDKNDERRARFWNARLQVGSSNLLASGNANTGRYGGHIDQNRRDVASRLCVYMRSDVREASSEQYRNYFTDIVNTLEQTSNQKDFKVHIVGVDGGTPEFGGCKIDVQPGPVGKPTEVEICLDNDPNHSPDSAVPVSHIFKCKPSKFEAPVHVRLISYLVPKPGKQLRVKIMSKTGGADWKQIQEVILGPGNEIEYSVSHFYWHVAVVSEEDEKDGEYHLFNDVWMHIPTGLMLSLFWKDWFSLTKGSKKLEVNHKRIISLPVEVIASVGDTVEVDIECLDHPEMKITSVDGSDGRIEIGSAMRRKNIFAMLIRPDPHLESLDATNRFEVIYRANVINGEGQRTDGGFSVPLHVTPSLLRSIGWQCLDSGDGE